MHKRFIDIIAAALVVFAIGSVSNAQVVTGYNTTSVPPQTDVFVSLPFTRQPVGTFTVQGTTSTSIQVTTSTFTSNQFANAFYLRLISGAGKGRFSTITSNDASTLVLQDPTILTGVVATDTLQIVPHWTLATVFPDNFEGVSFSLSPNAFARTFEILIPRADVGINKSASVTYFYQGGTWRTTTAATGNFDNDVLVPQRHFILRNRNSVASGKTVTFTTLGYIDPVAPAVRIHRDPIRDDLVVSTGLPLPTRLSRLHLGGFEAFQTTNAPLIPSNFRDLVLVYNNNTTGFNKAAQATYFFSGGFWRSTAAPTTNANEDILPAGAAITIRKFQGTAADFFWTQP